MADLLKATGKIVYDPYRGDMKSSTPWWCIVELDTEITRYYRWWLRREKHIILQQPSWDAHITVIRGERECAKHPALWKKYHGKRVNFTYEHGILHSAKDKDQPGHFWWITANCPELDELRKELGLRTGYQYHITIGRTYY